MEDKEQYHVLELPSKLQPYKEGTQVSVRFLKGKDEKFVGELTLSNFDKKYNLLLNQVLKGIDPKELTLGDRTYIAIWLSMNCYSHIYPIDTICDKCFNQVKVNVDLTKLNKIYLPDGFKEPYPVALTDDKIIPMRLLRVRDQIAYQDYVSTRKEDDTNFKIVLTMDNTLSLAERIDYVSNLDTKNLSILKAFHDKHIHGIDLTSYKFDCPKCKEVGETPIPFRFELLFPDSETVEKFARDVV